MSLYHIYAGADGESHIEEIHVAQHPELGALRQVAQVGIHEFPALRTMDFHPLTERKYSITPSFPSEKTGLSKKADIT